MRRLLTAVPRWIFTSIVTALILWLTLAPEPIPDTGLLLFPGADKLVHAIMFGGFSGTLLLDLCHRRPMRLSPPDLKVAMISLVIGSIFGAFTEAMQTAMGLGRTAEVWDFLSDVGGVIIGISISWRLISYLAKR